MELTINEALLELPRVDYRELKPLQGNLKELPEKEYERLKKSLEKSFFVPFFIWENEGDKWILDGHQRRTVLMQEDATPYQLPYIKIEAKTETEAKEKILLISSMYGKTTQEGFDEFSKGIDFSFIKDTTTFDLFADFSLYSLDYTSLDEEDLEEEFEDFSSGIRKSVQIEFEQQDYEKAFALIQFFRGKNVYVGQLIINFLEDEKKRIVG